MMRNLYAKWIAGLFCLGAAVLPAAEPVASLLYKSNLDVKNPSDMAAPAVKSKQNPLENFDTKEFSGGFWIRFDDIEPGETSVSVGPFDCAVNKDGFIELRFDCEPTELMADRLVLLSKVKPEEGKWYHVEFFYSFKVRRCALYVDGKWQTENDFLHLPAVRFKKDAVKKFDGEIHHFRLYNMALESEDLAIAHLQEQDIARIDNAFKAFNELLAKNNTPRFANLRDWKNALAKRYAVLKADANKFVTTIGEVRRLERDLSNAATIAEKLAADPAITCNSLATYSVSATSQEIFLPYTLPASGEFTNHLSIYAAKGEYESASVIVVPLRKHEDFLLKVTDLKNGKHTIPSSAVDVRLVKRWFRTGGAWMTYHSDKRQRVLTPDLLMKDDKAITVDEIARTNYMRLTYPTGTTYADISCYDYDRPSFDLDNVPFNDATELQPMDLPETGRNQQFVLTVHVPKGAEAGFYEGKVEMLSKGKKQGELKMTVRVLPFELPEPRTYADVNKVYFSHINRAPFQYSMKTYEAALKLLVEYNLMHPSGIAGSAEHLKIAKDVGLDVRYLVGQGLSPRQWFNNFGGPLDAMTSEHKAVLDKLFLRELKKTTDMYKSVLGFEPEWYSCGASESSYYPLLVQMIAPGVDLIRENSNGHLMTHGMSDVLYAYTSDFNSMDSATRIRKDWSEIWHAAGGRQMNYCNPFPGAENPSWYRRRLGLYMYKRHMDGHMLHGYIGRHVNEFDEWPGGDGNYRNFCMAYAQKNGAIPTLKLLGTREGYDDVRYASLMKMQALKYRDHKDQVVAREARRQLVWLEVYNGDKGDYDAFRAGAAHRIITLMELAKARGVK